MRPCILVYNDRINNRRDAAFLCSLFDGNALHVSSVTRSSSGVQGNCVCSQVSYSVILWNLSQIQHVTNKRQNQEQLNTTPGCTHSFLELLMMSEWRSKHVEHYHQIKSIKSYISSVICVIIISLLSWPPKCPCFTHIWPSVNLNVHTIHLMWILINFPSVIRSPKWPLSFRNLIYSILSHPFTELIHGSLISTHAHTISFSFLNFSVLL